MTKAPTLVTDWAKLPGVDKDYELEIKLTEPFKAGRSITVVSVNKVTGERTQARVRLRMGSKGRERRNDNDKEDDDRESVGKV